MTTIAWDGRTLASDSLVTSGSERVGFSQKARKLGPLLYVSSGSCGLGDRWEAWLRAGAKGDHPEMKRDDDEANGYVFMPGGIVVWFHAQGCTPLRAKVWAAGSGGDFARGALEAGLSAAEAVEIACRCDTASGGKITVLAP